MLPSTTLTRADPWIVNAAPFIGLAKIGRLALLRSSQTPDRALFLPETVYREIGAGPAADPACLALANLIAWGIILLPPATDDPRLTAFALDAGEAAVLTDALARPGSLCVIDDGPGRRAAKALGLDVTGTVGVLWQARQEGRLTALAPELRAPGGGPLLAPRDRSARLAGRHRRNLALISSRSGLYDARNDQSKHANTTKQQIGHDRRFDHRRRAGAAGGGRVV